MAPWDGNQEPLMSIGKIGAIDVSVDDNVEPLAHSRLGKLNCEGIFMGGYTIKMNFLMGFQYSIGSYASYIKGF